MKLAIEKAFPGIEILNNPHNFNQYNEIDYIWLNWYENIAASNIFTYIYIAFKRIVKLLLLKRKKVSIIYTVHNRQPHETKYAFLNRLILRIFLRISNTVIILSDQTKKILKSIGGNSVLRKTIKIPHPTYNCVPKVYSAEPEKFTVLFFGMLRPYKNIEYLLSIADRLPQIKFIIAGEAIDSEYATKLKSDLKRHGNVELIIHRLSDSEINRLMDEASILALPYNMKSSLNSGAAMYALSKGINLVIPQIGTIEELTNKDKVYSYSYLTDEEHFVRFEAALIQAYDDYYNSYTDFVKNAETLRTEVETTNSINAISQMIMNIGL